MTSFSPRPLPPEFLKLSAREVRKAFPEPAIAIVEGAAGYRPLLVSILLHGNETSGMSVAQAVCRKALASERARPLWLLVGNVRAAEMGVRSLPGAEDFNRIWAGGHPWAERVLAFLAQSPPHGAVDVHNNTGRNPPYACVPVTEGIALAMATRFAPDVVHLGLPRTTLTHALAPLCPSLTLECGRPGDPDGIQRAVRLIETLLVPEELPREPVAPYRLFGRCRRIEVPPGASLRFEDSESSSSDFVFPGLCEEWNFRWLAPGTALGRRRRDGPRLLVRDENGSDVTEENLDQSGEIIRLRRSAAPAMLTCDPRAVALDCLAYLMDLLS